jgi:hypothetical protein
MSLTRNEKKNNPGRRRVHQSDLISRLLQANQMLLFFNPFCIPPFLFLFSCQYVSFTSLYKNVLLFYKVTFTKQNY